MDRPSLASRVHEKSPPQQPPCEYTLASPNEPVSLANAIPKAENKAVLHTGWHFSEAQLEDGSCDPLRTDSTHDSCQYLGMMKKRKNLIENAKVTISSIKREMQKPRLTESVRNGRRDRAGPVAQELPARPG